MNSLTNMLLNFLPRFPENQFLTKLMVAANSKTFKQKLYSFCHNIKCTISSNTYKRKMKEFMGISFC